jgi:hypothetical protein
VTKRRLSTNKRGGFSVAIAVVMAMIVVVSLVQNILIWNHTITATDYARMNEHIDIKTIHIEDGTLDIEVMNAGDEITHLVSLWVNQTRYRIDLHLNSGESIAGVGSELTISPLPNNESIQLISVITARGNAAITEYTPPGPENPPPWWNEATYPVIIDPVESSIEGINLHLDAFNRFGEDIDIDLIVCTRVTAGTTSSKVQVINVDWTIPSEDNSVIDVLVDISVLNGDGLRVELVSSHNWIVGAYFFLF